MVLLVPDDTDDVTENGTPRTGTAEQPKAQLDDSEASRATQKVDLDLDDAPFLEDEDDEEIIEEVEEETPLFEKPEKESGSGLMALLKNKVVLVSSGIILLLLVIIVILMLREPEAPPPPPPPVEQPKVEETTEPAAEETPETIIRLDPFLIEQTDDEGTVRLLEIRILVSTPDDGLARQFKQEVYTVRNALFYYLKNKDLQFLSDKENSEKLRNELLAIVNQYMGYGQFDTLMFEQYLVR